MAAATDPMANSSADLSSRLTIDASKVKDKDRGGDKDKDRDKEKEKGGEKDKDEPPNSNASSAGDSNLPQDSLSLMQLKRVVGDMARVRVGLLFRSFSLLLSRSSTFAGRRSASAGRRYLPPP